jgi:hypothetical protein
MADDYEATAALTEALRFDPTFADAPDRLGRALLDLMPYRQPEARLLILGATVGVPALVSAGRPVEARDRLVGAGGLRPEEAERVVARWRTALVGSTDTIALPMLPGPAARITSGVVDGPGEAPGRPTAVRLAVWPDGESTIGVVTATGIYATHLGITAAPGARAGWRRIATPPAPTSRDVSIVTGTDAGVILWTDADGLYLCGIGRVPHGSAGTGLPRTEPRLIVPIRSNEQPRYPLAALGTDAAAVDVLWTVDRRTLWRGLLRPWLPAVEVVPVPPVCPPPERLTCLDVAQESDRSAWLVALTDRGRVLVSHWSLAIDDIGTWTEAPAPVDIVAAAIVALPAGPTVVACTPAGYLLSLDARRASAGNGRWRSVDRPTELPAPGSVHSLAAAASADIGWLAVSDGSATWTARLDRWDEVAVLSAARVLWLGG